MIYQIKVEGRTYQVQLTPGSSDGGWRCSLRENSEAEAREFQLDARETQPGVLSLLLEGRSYEIKREMTPAGVVVSVDNRRYAAEVGDPHSLRTRRVAGDGDSGPQRITAPMPGKIVRIQVAEKAQVEQGQGILVIEAMKMQNELKSPKKGVVRKILVKEGMTANAGEVLVIVE